MKRLKRQDVPVATAALGRAFFEDSLVSRLCPDESRRLYCTEPVFRFSANLSVGNGEGWSDDDMHCVALWLYSWRMGCPLWRWVQYGGLDIRRRMGPTAYRELTRVSDRIDHMRDRVAPQRYLYLSSLGVVPEHRREGLARALVLPRLQQAADEGLSTMVETNSEGALAFYQSVGFTVLAQFNISGLQYSVLEHRADPSAVRK